MPFSAGMAGIPTPTYMDGKSIVPVIVQPPPVRRRNPPFFHF